MKSAKKLFSLLVIMCCALALLVPSEAAEWQPLTETDNATALLSVHPNGQANCRVVVTAISMSHRVEATVSLNQIDNGSPTSIEVWTASSIGGLSFSQNYYVARGYDYQVVADIVIKDASGRTIETITARSGIKHH